MTTTHDSHPAGGRARRWILLGFLAIAGFYLVAEHRAHLPSLTWLPVVLLLLCPFLHMGMHGGHGGHGGGPDRDGDEPGPLPADRLDTQAPAPAHRHAEPEER